MVKKYHTIVLTMLIILSVASAQESDSPVGGWGEDASEKFNVSGHEESSGLYGYLIDYIQSSLDYTNREFSRPSFGNALLLRLKGDWRPETNLRFHLEFSYISNVGNQNPYVLYEKLGVAGFSQSDFPLEDYNQRMFFDHVWGMANFGNFDLQFGKFPVAWGTGYVFNPTARVAFPPFLDMVTEDTPGTMAILPSYALSNRFSLEAYLAFQDKTQKKTAFQEDSDVKNLPYGIKLNTIVGAFDLSLSWIKEVLYNDLDYRPIDDILTEAGMEYVQGIVANQMMADLLAAGDTATVLDMFKQGAMAEMTADLPAHPYHKRSYYTGFDFAGAIWDFGVYGEFAFRLPRDSNDEKFLLEDYSLSDNLEMCVGFDYLIPGIEIDTRFEYYYQGVGAKSKNDYNLLTVLSGEKLVNARNYSFLFLEKTIRDYHKFSLAFFNNLDDGSYALLPGYSYSPYSNFDITLGAFILGGSRGSEFDGRYTLYDVKEIDLMENLWPYLRLKISF
ncbi:MAG: hypothetical protein M0R34_07870 [Candidatus Marinimicrobia bacterium]|nr:hypothetical protein [Candidatus Neomarinimicrobiota bacterium]MCK9559636.1 hypothetical protein [Candidatus Neomarinimicrobiota bacterium]